MFIGLGNIVRSKLTIRWIPFPSLMELRHFRYFLALADALHFTRAAAALGIATPTLTRQIQDMEAELGVRLFARSQRSVTLTPAGQVLREEARRAVAQFEAAQLRAQREARGDTGALALGYVASAAYAGILQAQVAAFRTRYPAVTLSAWEAPMDTLPVSLREGRLDVAYVRSPMALPPGIEALRLPDEPFVLALPAASGLAGLARITPRHLSGETFILPEQISGTLDLAAQGNFVPTLGPQPGGLVAVLAQVSLGQGVAVVPGSVEGHVSMPGLVYRKLSGARLSSHLSLLWRRHETAPAIRRYVALVQAGG